MKMNDIPRLERPREKLVRYGVTRLSSSELVALVLGTGVQGKNAVELATHLLRSRGGQGLATMPLVELQTISGLGVSKAAALVACFELGRRLNQETKPVVLFSAKDVWLTLKGMRGHKKEYFIAFYLDSRNQLLSQEVISIGTVEACLVHPREVFEPALRCLASQVILVHNHPSGQLEPSLDDLRITERLTQVGQLLGIEVSDHIILTKDEYLSLKEAQYC